MSDLSFDSYELDSMEHASLPRKVFTHTIPILAAVSFSALVALRVAGGLASDALTTHAHPTVAAQSSAPAVTVAQVAAPQGFAEASSPKASAQVATAQSDTQSAAANPYGELFDPEGAGGGEQSLFSEAKPVGPEFSLFQADPLYPPDGEQQVAEAEPAQAPEPAAPLAANEQNTAALGLRLAEDQTVVPQPPARPADLPRIAKAEEEDGSSSLPESHAKEDSHAREESRGRVSPRVAARRSREQQQQASLAHNDPRNFFEKLFSGPQDNGPQLAYASPDGGSALKLSRGLFAATRPTDGETAIYNITAHTVTLPSGERLEAHSGLGAYFDDPDHVHLRMRGSTPPATYQLSLRESIFHGVQALRLTPIDSKVYGRGGLLAHTFMLGQRGDSNGCVSFRNYRAFLEAFRSGEIRKLKVVSGS